MGPLRRRTNRHAESGVRRLQRGRRDHDCVNSATHVYSNAHVYTAAGAACAAKCGGI